MSICVPAFVICSIRRGISTENISSFIPVLNINVQYRANFTYSLLAFSHKVRMTPVSIDKNRRLGQLNRARNSKIFWAD